MVYHSKRGAKTMSNIIQKILIFDCQIAHMVGSDNVIADYLSRNLVDDQEEGKDTTVTDVNIQNKQRG